MTILALWAVPRSTSTAFEWMMRVRGDFNCFHEPFGEVWYQGENPDWPRLAPDSLRTPGLTYESAWTDLQAAAAAGPVFTKDFPHYLVSPTANFGGDDFLRRFNHSFLIRHPAKTVMSMFKHWPDFHDAEVGLVEQRALFDRLTDLYESPPPVIDSDDLLADPAGIVAAWCQAMGISFKPEALSWEPGDRDEVSWWDGGSFHDNLRNSSGLKPQPRTSADLSEAPTRVQELVESILPHYEHMHATRLSAVEAPES